MRIEAISGVRIEGRTALKPAVAMLVVSLLLGRPALAQSSTSPDIPDNFKLDMEVAARLRPQLMAQSSSAAEKYATGSLVFGQLVQQLRLPAVVKLAWQIRIVTNNRM